MYINWSVLWLTIKHAFFGIFGGAFEDFISDVKKAKRSDGSQSYVFSSETIGLVNAESYSHRLEKSGFLRRYALNAILEENIRAIGLDGSGFHTHNPPWIIFLGDEVLLTIPFSQFDRRDWDEIALAMNNLFNKPAEAFA